MKRKHCNSYQNQVKQSKMKRKHETSMRNQLMSDFLKEHQIKAEIQENRGGSHGVGMVSQGVNMVSHGENIVSNGENAVSRGVDFDKKQRFGHFMIFCKKICFA